MHCIAFSELLEVQAFLKSDHKVMSLEQVTDPEGRRYHLFIWLLITDHWAASWDRCTDTSNQCSLITSWVVQFLKCDCDSPSNFSPIGKRLNSLLAGSSIQAEIYVLAFWRGSGIFLSSSKCQYKLRKYGAEKDSLVHIALQIPQLSCGWSGFSFLLFLQLLATKGRESPPPLTFWSSLGKA